MTVLVADGLGRVVGALPRRVLVIEGALGQGRSAVATVRALAASGYEPVVATTGDGRGPAAASRYCAATVRVPPASSPAFADAVYRELRTGWYLIALPVSDAAIAALGLDAVALLDKTTLEQRARRVGIRGMPGRVFETPAAVLDAADEFQYPIVVKAATVSARGGRLPATRIDIPRDLGGLPPSTGEVLVQPYMTDQMSAVAGVVWEGRLVAAVHQRYVRTWPVGCGTASYAVSVEPDRDTEDRLVRLLEGFRGIFQAQFLGPYLIDLNPRVYGSLPLAVAAGVNLPAILCRLVRGGTVGMQRGRAGVRYRWIEGDLRHLLRASRQGQMRWREVLSALRPQTGTAHSMACLNDPGPMAYGLLRAARSRCQ